MSQDVRDEAVHLLEKELKEAWAEYTKTYDEANTLLRKKEADAHSKCSRKLQEIFINALC